MVRSPHAHARINKISIDKAMKAPGVLGVFTGADCAADGLRPVAHSPMPSTKFDMKLGPPAGRSLFYGPHLLLPIDKARHAGEAVAMVVARTQDEALDAAELVDVHYEPRSEEHTSELQSRLHLVCRLLLAKMTFVGTPLGVASPLVATARAPEVPAAA